MPINENQDLISAIRRVIQNSDGYKIANIIHLILKIIVTLLAIGSFIYSLILNGIVALFKGGASLLSMEFFEMAVGSVAPLITISALSFVFISTPMHFIKGIIVKREVRIHGYDIEASLPIFRSLLSQSYEKSTMKEATIAGLGWSILFNDYSKKTVITRIVLGLFDIITYIIFVIALVILRILFYVFSVGGARSDMILIASGVFLFALLVVFTMIGKVQIARQTKLLNTIEKNINV